MWGLEMATARRAPSLPSASGSDLDPVREAVLAVREGLEQGRFRREADISAGAVARVLAALGWDVFDPRVVSRELPIGQRRADYALFGSRSTPAVLLEVKDVGKADARGEEQLFQYCFHQGVPIAVLTDGRLWKLFLPAGEGTYEDRCFAALDFLDHSDAEVAGPLGRFLGCDEVRSGRARADAQAACEARRRQRRAAAEFERVWVSVLSDPDPSVLDRFAQRVREATGIEPERGRIAEFFRSKLTAGAPVRKLRRRPPVPPPSDLTQDSATQPAGGRYSFTLFGAKRECRRAKDVLVAVFTELARRDATFCERFAAKVRGRTRVYLATDRSQLYSTDPATMAETAELPGGWWISTHSSSAEKERRIRRACEIAGLKYGRDLVVHLPTRKRTPPAEDTAAASR